MLLPAVTWAQASFSSLRGLSISADESDRDNEADTLDLRGNVQIIFKDQHLSCASARINFRAKTIDAMGDVIIVGPKATAGGERVYLDYESNTGVIYGGYVQAGNVYVEGRLITRMGESDYLADGAKFTTCTNCPESWSFSGQRIRAELGGYAYIKNSFLRIGGFPIIWLPYLIVPLKSDRQSGLLTPDFEVSDSGGLTFSESFFWAMSRSTDSTWTFKNYELRGFKTLVNYRYALSENSSGELDVGLLRDRVFSSDRRLNTFRSGSEQNEIVDRWFLKYEHYYEMPEGYIQRMQLNNASDLQYPKDFPLETRNHGDSAMENRVSLTKNNRSQHYSLDSSYYVNLMQANPLAGNSDAVHRLPELRFSQAMSPLASSGLLYTADFNYTNFARAEFAYDDLNAAYNPNNTNDRHLEAGGGNPKCTTSEWYNFADCRRSRDGTYNADKDLIRTGQRLDGRATLYRPIKIAETLDILPQISYRETQYLFNVGEDLSNTRRYIRAEISARSLFSRIYGSKGPGSFERLKHEIQPELRFTTIPWISQPTHAFFGSEQESPFFSQENVSDADINGPYGVQFDYNDRIYDRKLATLALTNRLIQKRWLHGNPDYRQVVSWRLAQSYDFYQAESSIDDRRKQPWSDLLSDLRVNFDSVQIYQRANYYPSQQVTNSSTRVRLRNQSDDFVELGYLLLYNDIAPGQEVDPDKKTEDYTLSVRKNFSFVELLGRVVYDVNPPAANAEQRFKSYGYGAQVKLPGDCWYFTITQYRITGGDNNFKVNFDFIWDGQKKPSLPEGLLDSFGF
ncbi:MAG: LPS-assembly protein LptD [Bdellovibrio sp.]